MKLVVVRHLPTVWNVEDRLQGRRDIPLAPLSDAAQAQLHRQVEQVREIGPFDAVYCSSLSRTRQTAELFGFSTVLADPLLDELNFGDFEGKLRHEMLAKVGSSWVDAPETLVFGEAVTALGERVREFVRKNMAFSNVLAFGHGGWTRALVSLNRIGSVAEMNRVNVANGELVTFEFQPMQRW